MSFLKYIHVYTIVDSENHCFKRIKQIIHLLSFMIQEAESQKGKVSCFQTIN